MPGAPVLRVARACASLAQARRICCEGLGLDLLAELENHQGLNGRIAFGEGAGWYLGLVVERGAAVGRPSTED